MSLSYNQSAFVVLLMHGMLLFRLYYHVRRLKEAALGFLVFTGVWKIILHLTSTILAFSPSYHFVVHTTVPLLKISRQPTNTPLLFLLD